MSMPRSIVILTKLLCLLLLGGCSGDTGRVKGEKFEQDPAGPDKIELPGIHNVYCLSEQLYIGSSPEGEEGFASLEKLGVKTIISVDGARPEVERARAHGMRYVHLPIGYHGVPEEQGLRIARAIRDLAGPVYLHCHHGKHRAPAAAAVARLCLDERCSVATVLGEMKRAGTDPQYIGLYAAPKELNRPTKEDLDRVSADFPEVSEVTGWTAAMVEIDEHWERLKAVRQAGWKSPREHPDIDPPHEALLLMEAYRELARLLQMKERPEELRRWLSQSEREAQALADVLRPVKEMEANLIAAKEAAYKAVADSCLKCHRKYRDIPQGP